MNEVVALARQLVDVDPDFSMMLPSFQDRYVRDVQRLAYAVLVAAGERPAVANPSPGPGNPS